MVRRVPASPDCRSGGDPARAGRCARSAGSDRRARRIPCSRRCGRCRAQTAAARRTSRRNRAGSVRAGTSEPTPTTTPGTSELPATAWIIARSSGELYMIARTPRKIGPKIDSPTAGSRSAVGTRIALPRDAPRAVERVVVPIAEEEDVVEAWRRAGDVVDQRRARRSLALEPGELVGDGVDLLRTRYESAVRTRAAGVRD